VIAYVFGHRKDVVFKKIKAWLAPFNISRYYTDDWGAYERHLDPEEHEVGKTNTQKIERKNLNFRTWIKRLARRTICFSKLETMHDIVIGLLINKVEFGRDIHAWSQIRPTTLLWRCDVVEYRVFWLICSDGWWSWSPA
jgi:insertion element IS1 protein InsB